MEAVTAELISRLERIVGRRIDHIHAVNRGYTPALRLRVFLADGTAVFAKVATIGMTGEWLHREKRIYDTLGGQPFLPRPVGWDDDGTAPILVMEDLSDAHWPPPWDANHIHLVRETMEQIWASSVPGLASLTEHTDLLRGWDGIVEDPTPFLSLGLATQNWLEAALPVLRSIDGVTLAQGDSLLHCDLRSDNLCLRPDHAVLIDWNHTCYGNPLLDFAFWLPSLCAEGGPLPDTALPDGGDAAAIVAGYFASRAGLPIIPEAPRVREIQKVQLRIALPWTVRALGLPQLDGPNAA